MHARRISARAAEDQLERRRLVAIGQVAELKGDGFAGPPERIFGCPTEDYESRQGEATAADQASRGPINCRSLLTTAPNRPVLPKRSARLIGIDRTEGGSMIHRRKELGDGTTE